MQTTFALAALAAVAYALPQGGASGLAPSAPSPPGCSPDFSGDFQITIINGSSLVAKRELDQRAASTCGQEGFLTAKLAGGVLTDSQGRIGSIVANFQFQFDGPPPQAGAIYTAGWSVCQNGSLALGGSTIFYSCQSGDFSNLYDRSWAPLCKPIFIDVIPCGASGGAGQSPDGQPTIISAAPPVSQITDGQPQGTSAIAPPATQISDGQVQVPTAVSQIGDGQLQVPTAIVPAPVSQISDGQVQVTTAAAPPVTQISDGQVQAPTTAPAGSPVTQISDGQVQVPTTAASPVTQISDGQVQAPTTAPAGSPVSQISDGQVQVPTTAPAGSPVSQISDGQVQVPTTAPTGAPVSQISDGQIQATTASPPVVSQIPDGQIQAGNNVTAAPTPTPTPAPFTGTGNGLSVAGSLSAFVVGLAAVLLL